MSPIVWMIGMSVALWLGVTWVARVQVNPELFWGMLGPLASAVITWVVVARTQRSAPERVTSVLVAGFAAKIVFFGAYMAIMLRVVGLRLVPFAVAFVGYVIALYVIEALFLKRLFVDGMRSSPSASGGPGH
jgi:hypothetical protein